MKELISHITYQLQDLYPEDEARALAWWVVEESMGLSRNEILLGCKGTKNIPNVQAIVDRLRRFEPIQYIFGHSVWNGLDLIVTPDTLIPRPETAELVERIARFRNSKEPLKILDVGTGSGCIAIALKKAFPIGQVTGVDVSEEALVVAKKNAERNGVEVNFKKMDILSDFNEQKCQYDIVISNPPYICESEKKDMRANVLEYEPGTALFVPDKDPLLFYRRIADLRWGKYLFFEINERFAQQIQEMLIKKGYRDVQLTNDMYGKPRIIQARLSE